MTLAATVGGLLLAAGAGSRLGMPKALLEFDGVPLVDRGVAALVMGGCHPVHVVLGAARRSDLVRAGSRAVRDPAVAFVENGRWQDGMSSSLRAGLVSLPATAEAAIVALVDQPLIGPAVIRRLLAAHAVDASTVAVATYDGRQRNPVLLPRAVWPDVAAAAHDELGARAYLRQHPELVTEVECGDIGSAADIDTAEDLQALSARKAAAARRTTG